MKFHSKTGASFTELFIAVTVIGLLIAMAIPAFHKVKNASVSKHSSLLVTKTSSHIFETLATTSNPPANPNYIKLERVLGQEPTPIPQDLTLRTLNWVQTPERMLKVALALDFITSDEYLNLKPAITTTSLTLVPSRLELGPTKAISSSTPTKEEILYGPKLER